MTESAGAIVVGAGHNGPTCAVYLAKAGLTVNVMSISPDSVISTEEHLWGPFTASGTMIMVPVIAIALVAQRQIVRGLTLGAVKR